MPTKKVDLAALLKSTREARKLSMRALAKKSGVNYATVQRCEAGVGSARLDTLKKLGAALDIDPLLLFHAAA
jgi:transcriptional regulator with XRE-family HTH domain